MLPLSDTLVLDLTQVIAGPTAGQMLGDMGADVIKVEPLQGEHFRPHFGGAWVPSMNRNKRGLAVDLRNAGGRDVLMRLVRKADVFMEAFTPGVIDKLGFGWETVSKENPRLVYASISGYGQTGPYSSRAGYDPCIQAEVGLIEATGPQDGASARRRSTIAPARSAPPVSPSPCSAGTRPAAASASTSRCSMSACT
jgi:formyl-CoA transferase/succinate--hydroxymethylglutarate CoA-transferase